ncbi:MAG: hypothetical protein V7752_14470 [Halopseudomonas sp.]
MSTKSAKPNASDSINNRIKTINNQADNKTKQPKLTASSLVNSKIYDEDEPGFIRSSN